MDRHKIVSQDEWFQAHEAHLVKEKAFSRLGDKLAAERRDLPWMKIQKDYVFDTTEGRKTLAELFKGRSQLLAYHFMFGPGADYRCEGCSFLSDHIDAADQHLKHHDVSVIVASRAPLEELLPYKQRMGWKFDWVSSGGSDFNYDMQVSYTDEQIAAGETIYNFRRLPLRSKDLPGISVFARDEKGDVYLTFVTRGRGGEALIGTYGFLDLMPKGRNENGPNHNLGDWVRLHDEYDDADGHACCH